MAVVVTFGRLAADNEWLAVTLSGMHPVRVLWPTVLFTALIAAAHYPLASVLAPDLKIQQRQYLADTIVAAASKLSPGKTKIELGDFVLNSAHERLRARCDRSKIIDLVKIATNM